MDFKIKLLEFKDLQMFTNLWTTAFKTDPYAFRTTSDKWSNRQSEEVQKIFSDSIAEPNFIFGLFTNDNLIGMVGVRKLGSDFYLWGTYVEPEFRKMNFGEKLVSTAIQNFHLKQPSVSQIYLEVFESAKAARFLYKKLGFTELEPNANGEIKCSKNLL